MKSKAQVIGEGIGIFAVVVVLAAGLLYTLIKNPSPSLVKGECLSYHSDADEFTPSEIKGYYEILEVGNEKYLAHGWYLNISTQGYSDKFVKSSEATTISIRVVEKYLGEMFKKIDCSAIPKNE